MANLAITNSEKFGKLEGVPTILLSEAVAADETVNMRERYGEYRAIRGRLPELFDNGTVPVKIKTPTDVFAITSIVSGSKTINITGDHSAGSTVLAVGATIRVNGSSTAANNLTFTVDSLPTTSSIVVTEAITTQAASGSVFVGTTPVIEYHSDVTPSTQTEYLLLATAYHVFLWSFTDKSLTVKFTSLTPGLATHWSIVTHLGDVYATNNVDLIQQWPVDSSAVSDPFNNLGSVNGVDVEDGTTFVIKARFLASFERYLFLFYVTYNDNSIAPLIGHQSSLADVTDFDVNSAGDAQLINYNKTPDFLVGAGVWENTMIVFKQLRHLRQTLVTDDAVWSIIEESMKIGALSQHAIVNDKAGRLYWLASDLTIREIRTPLSVSELVDRTVKSINTSVAEFARMTFIDTFGTINLAIATESSTTNNKVISFNPDNANSFVQDIPVRAFGGYTRQATFTYDTLPFDTYADWGASWLIYDSQVNVVGFPLDLASDYGGDTFDMYQAELDDGVPMTRAFVFNTNMGEIFPFKRVNNGVYGIFRRQSSGTVSFYIKDELSSGWTLLGTMSLASSNGADFVIVHLPFDVRFQNARFKSESPDRMEIIGWIFRDFEMDDDR